MIIGIPQSPDQIQNLIKLIQIPFNIFLEFYEMLKYKVCHLRERLETVNLVLQTFLNPSLIILIHYYLVLQQHLHRADVIHGIRSGEEYGQDRNY